MTVDVVGIDVVVGGAALDPPQAVKADPISTSVPMTSRCRTRFIGTTSLIAVLSEGLIRPVSSVDAAMAARFARMPTNLRLSNERAQQTSPSMGRGSRARSSPLERMSPLAR